MRLKDLIGIIDIESLVETTTETDMWDGKLPTPQGTWGEYTKRLSEEEWEKKVRLLPQYGIRIVFQS